jgi:hypothetical protein
LKRIARLPQKRPGRQPARYNIASVLAGPESPPYFLSGFAGEIGSGSSEGSSVTSVFADALDSSFFTDVTEG